jgi:hypothetical protein
VHYGALHRAPQPPAHSVLPQQKQRSHKIPPVEATFYNCSGSNDFKLKSLSVLSMGNFKALDCDKIKKLNSIIVGFLEPNLAIQFQIRLF